jgi:hypothetical protein
VKTNPEEFVQAVVAALAERIDRAAQKQQLGEDHQLDLVAINLLFIQAGVKVTEIFADKSMLMEKVPPEKRDGELKKMLAEFLRLAPADKLPKA